MVRLPLRYQGAVVCLGSAAAAVLLLAITLRLDRADLHVPLNYGGDANVFIAKARSISDGNWHWSNPRLGAPFGADWRDYPQTLTLDSAVMWMIGRFTTSPGVILNLAWIGGVAATAGLAAFAFLRLGFGLAVSAAAACIYALSPYTYFSGVHHLNSLYYSVPLIAAAALEIATGRQRFPRYAIVGCVLAGLSYIYLALFACFVLVVAGLLGRTRRALAMGCVLAGLVGAIALVDLAPSLLYRFRNGANAAMLFKSPAETQLYSMKLRYLVTPVPGHVLPPLRALEERLAPAKYPLFPNESEWGRLGLFGSIGLAYLLLFAARALMGSPGDRVIGAAAALTLACILLTTVGGLNDFVAALITPDIRAWARVFPYIAFFCVLSGAALVRRWPAPVLAGVVILAAFDQALPASRVHAEREARFRADAAMVESVDGAQTVFQLPHTDFPNDVPPGRMTSYDHLRGYIHSRQARWSAGAVSGTLPAEWSRSVAALQASEMLERLVQHGFTLLWVDAAGYADTAEVTRLLGAPVRSSGGIQIYDLRSCVPVAPPPVELVFERGFSYEESASDKRWRWSLRRSRLTLLNPGDAPQTVRLSFRLETPDSRPRRVRIGPYSANAPGFYERQIAVPSSGHLTLDFECDCDGVRPPGSDRTLYFAVSSWQLSP
jgi:phosphoglycerol transferase